MGLWMAPSLFSRFKGWGFAAIGAVAAGVFGWFYYKSRGTMATGQPTLMHPSAVTGKLVPVQ